MISLSVHLYNIRCIRVPCNQHIYACIPQSQSPRGGNAPAKKLLTDGRCKRKLSEQPCFVVQMKIGYGTFATTYHDIVDFIFPTNNTLLLNLPFQFFF